MLAVALEPPTFCVFAGARVYEFGGGVGVLRERGPEGVPDLVCLLDPMTAGSSSDVRRICAGMVVRIELIFCSNCSSRDISWLLRVGDLALESSLSEEFPEGPMFAVRNTYSLFGLLTCRFGID